MAVLKKYNLSGAEVEQVQIDDALLQTKANPQMIKDYLVTYNANQRQWSANTKGRSEVKHSNQKPHPQKGSGRARQGSLAAPQYKGGGRVFGPKPKFNQTTKLNKKERQSVIKHLIAQKVKDEKLHLLSVSDLESPKTKSLVEFLTKMNLMNKRVLFVDRGFYEYEIKEEQGEFVVQVVGEYVDRSILAKSVRNIPKISFSLMPNVNGYELMLCQDVVLVDGALDEFKALLQGKSSDE